MFLPMPLSEVYKKIFHIDVIRTFGNNWVIVKDLIYYDEFTLFLIFVDGNWSKIIQVLVP